MSAEHAGRDLLNLRDAASEIEKIKKGGKATVDRKPFVHIPGGSHSITDAALALGRLLGERREYFHRGGAVVRVTYDENGVPSLQSVKASMLTSAFERVARIVKDRKVKDEVLTEPTVMTEQGAKQILESLDFKESLPPLKILSPCPVMIRRGDSLVEISGYDRRSGVLASGKKTEAMTVKKARDILNDVLNEFHFASEADRGRALAAMVTPALVFGGILNDKKAMDLGEADQPQTGKGFRNKITAAIYNQQVKTVTQQKKGVGSMEEMFDSYLVNGANFICLDNLKGKIDSCKIEMFLTEENYPARVPFLGAVNIDPRRTIVMLTSNKAEMTGDLAKRSSCVRLLHRGRNHNWTAYKEGDILDHIRANQPKYLGAVFSILKAWDKDKQPRSRETRHNFRTWVQTLDYIVQKYLASPPLMQGHTETQERMTNPTINWMRDIMLLIRREGRQNEWLKTHDLVDIISESEVMVPGLGEDGVLDDENVRKRVLQAMGRKLAICFRAGDELRIDGHIARRNVVEDPFSQRPTKEYIFEEVAEVPF